MQHANSETLNCIRELSHYCWNEVKREESAYYLYLRKKPNSKLLFYLPISPARSPSYFFYLQALISVYS